MLRRRASTGKGLVGGGAAVWSVAKCPGVAFRVGGPPKLIDHNDATMQKPRVRRLSTGRARSPCLVCLRALVSKRAIVILCARLKRGALVEMAARQVIIRFSSTAATTNAPASRLASLRQRVLTVCRSVYFFLEAAAPARARTCQAALRAAAAAQRAGTRRYAPGAAVRSDRTPTAAGCNSEIAEPRALAPKRWPSAITP